jgi:hypothetical protein
MLRAEGVKIDSQGRAAPSQRFAAQDWKRGASA